MFPLLYFTGNDKWCNDRYIRLVLKYFLICRSRFYITKHSVIIIFYIGYTICYISSAPPPPCPPLYCFVSIVKLQAVAEALTQWKYLVERLMWCGDGVPYGLILFCRKKTTQNRERDIVWVHYNVNLIFDKEKLDV